MVSYLITVSLLVGLLLFSFQTARAQEPPSAVYPKVMGYFSAVHPIVSFDKEGSTSNFSNSYVVGFPAGVNILKSDKIGFSFEITPFIKAENNDSKVYNLLFHPGVIFRLKNGFSITERAAFETLGRYGFTTVFTKVVVKGKNSNLFIAVPLPARFGNEKPASIGFAFQVGVSF